MSIPEDKIEKLRAFGYSDVEARFLYLVATHSGYFTVRQFLDFAHAKSGKRNARLVEKLFGLGHASARRYNHRSLVFQLRSRPIYAAMAGTPINPKNLANRALRPACRELKLPVVGWHSFRHTHATLLTEVGESIKTTQAILGHSDLETTLNIYSHPIPESQRRAVERVAEILDPHGLKTRNPLRVTLSTD